MTEADELVCSLMQTRGYPVADFDQRAADISVDHPRVMENYRSAHDIALRLGRAKPAQKTYERDDSLSLSLRRPYAGANIWRQEGGITPGSQQSSCNTRSIESCYGTEEKVMMKPSTENKTTGKLHEVKGNIKEKVGKLTEGP